MKHAIPMALLGLLSVSTSGTEYYISNREHDGNPGTSSDAPWLTIATANAAVAPGDTVHIRKAPASTPVAS